MAKTQIESKMPNSKNLYDHKDTHKYFWIIFLFLLSIYLLSYNGFPVSDDEHLFAGVSQSLASYGGFDPTQVYGNPRLSGAYQGIGPLHSIIGAFLLSLIWKTNLGALQSLYILNPIYTAATAAFIYLLADKYSYSRKTSIISALLFGLTTIVWPYTQTFYREPLAMLLLIASLWLFEIALQSRSVSNRKHLLIWLLFLTLILGALLTKIILLVTIPFFIIKFILGKSNKINKRNLIYLSTFMAGCFFFIFVFNWLSNNIFPNRLSIKFLLERWDYFWQNLSRDQSWLNAIIGILISPMKGLFIYSPITLLTILSIFKRIKKNASTQIFYLGSIFGVIIIQAVMYKNEWWNISWGTRFLLPILPLMMLSSLPVIEDWVSLKKKTAGFVVISAALIGFIIQLGRVFIADVIYLEHIYSIYKIPDLQLALWRLDIIPFVTHWKILFNGALPNLASFRTFSFQPKLVLLLQAILIFLAVISLIMLLSQKSKDFSRQTAKLLLFAGGSVILALVFLLIVYRYDPLYRNYREDFKDATTYLEGNIEKDDIVLIDHYMSEYWFYFYNFGRIENPWFGLYSPIDDTEKISNQISEIEGTMITSNNTWWVYENTETIGEENQLIMSLNFQNMGCWQEDYLENGICLYTKGR